MTNIGDVENAGTHRRVTPSGIEEKVSYCPEDIAALDYAQDLADPGEYPFTRGLHREGFRSMSWMKREVSGFGLPEQTNDRLRYLHRVGQEGYGDQLAANLVFDLPTQYGYDSDDPLLKYEVGKCGVAVSGLRDFERLLEGFPPDKTNTSFILNATAGIMLAMHIANAERQGVPRARLIGVTTNSPLRGYISDNMHVFPPEAALRLMVDIVQFCTREMPLWNTINLVGYSTREAGATAVQELAFTMAIGIEVIESCLAKGLDIDAFAPRLSFFWGIHNHLFEDIAKIRAARRMWAKMLRERFGARNRKSWLMRAHVQTCGSTLTAAEPLNNIARVALQAFAAVMAGIQGLHTNSYDEAFALPTAETVRIALKTQKIIQHETGVCDVADPLGGSYYVESLTRDVEEAAWEYIRKIAALGGYVAAVRAGYLQREIANASYNHHTDIQTGKRIVVGVNRYVEERVPIRADTFRFDPEVQAIAAQRVKALREQRDQARAREALETVRGMSRDPNGPLMPAFVEAVTAHATIGEIAQVLREEWGEYQQDVVTASC